MAKVWATALFILASPLTAHAGQVTAVLGGSTDVLLGGSFIGPGQNNDEGQRALLVFGAATWFRTTPLDIVLNVGATDGITEYNGSLILINSTPEDWSTVRFTLGTGVGAGFTPNTDLLFDLNPTLPNVPGGAGSVDPASVRSNQFDLHVPAPPLSRSTLNVLAVIDVPDLTGETSATLRVSPAPVPEPSTGLLLIAAAGCIAQTRRRQWS